MEESKLPRLVYVEDADISAEQESLSIPGVRIRAEGDNLTVKVTGGVQSLSEGVIAGLRRTLDTYPNMIIHVDTSTANEERLRATQRILQQLQQVFPGRVGETVRRVINRILTQSGSVRVVQQEKPRQYDHSDSDSTLPHAS